MLTPAAVLSPVDPTSTKRKNAGSLVYVNNRPVTDRKVIQAVRVAYLICRVVDTIEDTADIPPPLREQLFDTFDELTEILHRGALFVRRLLGEIAVVVGDKRECQVDEMAIDVI